MSASAADAIERAAGAVAVCLAFVVPPALAMDPCEVDLGSAPETKLSGSPLTWDLPAVGKWRVTRRDAGGRVSEGCGLGVIEAPLSAVRGVIDAAADFDQFMPRVLESEVEPISPGVYLNRQILADSERAKILGLNAARIFGFEIPERYLGHPDAATVAAQR